MPRINLGRLDNSKNGIEVVEGMSILSALRTNGFEKADNEIIQDLDFNEYDGSEEVESGLSYYLVAKVKSGQ